MPTRRRRPTVLISSSQRALRVPRKRIADLVAFVARREGVRLAEVDLAVVAAGEMAGLNRRYLARGGATDVLSFDLSEAGRGGLCVQLVVCGDVAAAQAAARGQGTQRELMLYVVHGLLHQMGYEDSSIRGAAKMHARQDELLEDFLRRR
ncbi:MAG: rRNA maturation RNase YbeY [Phycisphaerae bacterium]|nr:rRNA maturation RNase YbeY [Phycisphaerae bacterium]